VSVKLWLRGLSLYCSVLLGGKRRCITWLSCSVIIYATLKILWRWSVVVCSLMWCGMFIAVLGSEFGDQPRNTEAVSGDDITLTCVPPRGEPSPRVRWSKDNSPLKPDADRISVLSSGSLRIRDVNSQDAGSYVCIAFNIGGERDSNAARLLVRGLCTSLRLSVCLCLPLMQT